MMIFYYDYSVYVNTDFEFLILFRLQRKSEITELNIYLRTDLAIKFKK